MYTDVSQANRVEVVASSQSPRFINTVGKVLLETVVSQAALLGMNYAIAKFMKPKKRFRKVYPSIILFDRKEGVFSIYRKGPDGYEFYKKVYLEVEAEPVVVSAPSEEVNKSSDDAETVIKLFCSRFSKAADSPEKIHMAYRDMICSLGHDLSAIVENLSGEEKVIVQNLIDNISNVPADEKKCKTVASNLHKTLQVQMKKGGFM